MLLELFPFVILNHVIAFIYAYFFHDFLRFDMSLLLLTVTLRGVSNKHCLLSLFSLPDHSGSLSRIDYSKRICLALPLSFECFLCSYFKELIFIFLLTRGINLKHFFTGVIQVQGRLRRFQYGFVKK